VRPPGLWNGTGGAEDFNPTPKDLMSYCTKSENMSDQGFPRACVGWGEVRRDSKSDGTRYLLESFVVDKVSSIIGGVQLSFGQRLSKLPVVFNRRDQLGGK
jgi:hypothetical protein